MVTEMGTKADFSTAALRKFMLREARVWGANCRARRKALGLTLQQVAESAFTNSQTVFKVERGQIIPRDHLRLALAFALACEPDELFPMPKRAAVLKEVA